MPSDVRDGVSPRTPRFPHGEDFMPTLRRRLAEHLERTGQGPRDVPAMYRKTVTLALWFLVTYLVYMALPTSWLLGFPVMLSMGLVCAAIGFNIMHDGNHKAYSERAWVNRLMGFSLDMLGASSYVWNYKHNVLHHTFANIHEHDDDLDLGFLGRLCPHQKRLPFHRVQHFYLWFLYGLLSVKWHFFDDFFDVLRGRSGTHKLARPRGLDLVQFLAGKVVFATFAFGLPLLVHPFWFVALVYLGASFVQGLVMAVVFQLAHCVTGAEFPLPDPESLQMENEWAIHQVRTTMDFARESRLLCWYLGGLNFQVEHHLFPRVCHLHYPALSRIVEETCREYGIPYSAAPSFAAAVASHYRQLRALGRPEQLAA